MTLNLMTLMDSAFSGKMTSEQTNKNSDIDQSDDGLGSLSRHKRIKFSRDFHRARDLGERYTSRYFIANFLRKPNQKVSRLGVITSRKLGPAIVRNRARRILRAAFRTCYDSISAPIDLVLVARKRITGRKSTLITQELLRFLESNNLLRSKGDLS